jgi:transcriptional regulator with XRE-family HTH domain
MSKIILLKTMEETTRSKILEIDKLVGANINYRRLMLGLTLDEISTHLGVSIQQLGKYEKGINRISAGKLLIFSEILKVPVDYFFNQIEESKMLINESKSIQSLVKAFSRIRSRTARKNIIKLTQTMAKEA